MNRVDFQAIAFLRLDEAENLFAAKHFSGAYYLAGYVVECALKACIAKLTQQHDFPPDVGTVRNLYTHDLKTLLSASGLRQELLSIRQQRRGLGQRWDTVKEWSESSRYRICEQADAESMLDAVGDREEGVFLWLTQHW